MIFSQELLQQSGGDCTSRVIQAVNTIYLVYSCANHFLINRDQSKWKCPMCLRSICRWLFRLFKMSWGSRGTWTSCSSKTLLAKDGIWPWRLSLQRRTTGGYKPSMKGRSRSFSCWGRHWRRWSWGSTHRSKPWLPETSRSKNFWRCCRPKVGLRTSKFTFSWSV